MEGQALVDLLECPLCSQRLDVSAKVLPCQHTFCKPCLLRQEASVSQLLCPECATPVQARSVEELPVNLLLVRLLEGLQGSMGTDRGRQCARYMVPLFRDISAFREAQEHQGPSEIAARTSYNRGETLGELALTTSNGITRRHKPEENWQPVSTNSSSGSVPAGVMQGVSQSMQHYEPLALCRALYDFSPKDVDLEDSVCCLSFLKGDILTVIRRVDENWIEAKLGDKVGIFPFHLTEPNSVAAKLLEGKSLKGSDSAESPHPTRSRGTSKARTTHSGFYQVPVTPPIINALTLPDQGKQPRISGTSFQTGKGQTAHIGAFNSLNHQGQVQPHQLRAPFAVQGGGQPSRVSSHHVKRWSETTQRHSSQGEKKMNSETPPTITMALVNPQTASASADSKPSSTQQLSISVCAALYSYKPRRPEELELRKGEMVGVYGKFKEGWLRGLSLRTGKVGVLPGNYVTPVLRTSARLLETKAATTSSSTVAGKRQTISKNPAVVLALDRVNTDGAVYSTVQVPSGSNGSQHAMSSASAGKSFSCAGAPGWDTVRRVFNPHRGSAQRGNQYTHSSNPNHSNHSQSLTKVQTSGYSPALQKKKHSNLPGPGRPLGWISETTASSAGAIFKDRDLTGPPEAAFQHDKQLPNGPHSILVKPDSLKSNTDKPAKSVRFLTEEDSLPPRLQTSSWSSGNQVASDGRPAPEVWAPSLTLGRDGPGIILKEGKAPVFRKGLEMAVADLKSNPQKMSAQSSLSAVLSQFSPSRHKVVTTYLAQTDSELSLLQGEHVLVHRPRPDGRVLVTQETSGQTGLFHSSVLQTLERLS